MRQQGLHRLCDGVQAADEESMIVKMTCRVLGFGEFTKEIEP